MNIFTINRSEIEDRLDPFFYNNKPDFSHYIKLSKIATVKGGKRIPLGKTYSDIPTDYLYLRVADMVDDTADYNSLKSIDSEVYKILKNYEMVEGDIALSIAGSIGKVLCTRNIPSFKKVILTENCAKIQVKKDIVLPEYMTLLLTLDTTQKQIDLNYIQTTIPKLGLDRIRNIYIPKIPNLSKQQKIVSLYEELKNQANQKKQESQILLENIDTYLLNELGITIAPKDNSLKNRIFTVTFKDITSGRFDPQAYIPSLEQLRAELKKTEFKYLKDVVTESNILTKKIDKSDIYVGLENIESNTGYYISNLEKESISSALCFEKGQVLFPKLRPYLNKVHLADFNGICSTEFHVFNAINIDVNFLHFCLLSKIILAQTENLMTGNTLPRLQSSDIANIMIPYPPLSKQKEIADYIKSIREQAKKLQKEAEQIFTDAKRHVEKMILGE